MILGASMIENTLFILLLTVGGYGYLPDASQEGILRPFRSYSDVTMFHYNVPPETLRATWQFAAFTDNPECPPKKVFIYLQHGSYPLINASTLKFPSNAFIGRTSLHLITTQSSFEPRNPTVFPVYNPLPGNWYAVAYVLNWDKQVKQEGISRKCHYSLGSVSLWSRAKDVTLISTGAPKEVYSTGTYSYYKFYIPARTWNFSLRVSNCSYRVSSVKGKAVDLAQFCITNLALSPKALPSANQEGAVSNTAEGSGHTFVVTEPFSECYYYLLVKSEARISFNVEIIVEECRYDMHLRNDFKKLERLEELFKSATLYTAKRWNKTDEHSRIDYSSKRMVRSGGKSLSHEGQEKCPPIYHLMRIKHSEDFAVTFLLEGDEGSTNWISLSDAFVTFAALEIQPFVDIGGTLSISINLDDQQLNSLKQVFVVDVCIKQGTIPKVNNGSILCSSELKMTVMSANVNSSEAKTLIPYPEPGTWFFAFHLSCMTDGFTVPCDLADVLLKLDVRLHRCVFPIDSCGSYGICRETHKGLHHFTSCFCLGGYNGWGCTDGQNAIHHSTLLLNTLLLTLSNVFFIPAIVLAIRRSMISEALVYLATMMFSMLYHACDEDFYSYCVTKYEEERVFMLSFALLHSKVT
ncbi:post-GPI attachment to proteins factor 6 isoform X2 [Ischnura elegans]|uniref:post-GPI attachment to proteins factor 6 isoform X2 n=1 Tax=Ischnura elegans TaxID=197161 RepID=UPI001ED87B28|nr:post-GPI attachment to proteins factor 6 isoform X2 [Ischnura elegans]